jgi:hypothetical protein
MISQWFDESDFQKWIDDNPELKSEIEGLKSVWMFEFDTEENRKMMNYQFEQLIKPYIRERKVDFLLDDK